MTLNLSQLKELMSPLSLMCKKEKEVDLSGIKVTLKYLNPKEELEVQKMLPNINDGETTAVEFADVFRRETLCRAVIQVADLDLRSVIEIETGESLANGTPVSISKGDAVLEIISTWARPLINKLFEQYGVLSEEIESEMDDSLKMNIESTELEKENLQGRIENLDRADKLENLSDEKEVS
jgi:hypothetical protein